MTALVRLPSGGALHHEGPERAAGPALLFLHGVGGGAWSWAPQRAALSPTWTCFTWEARGHGQASPCDDAGLADSHRDAQEALAWILENTRHDVVLVGHSMGGLIAVALACEVRTRIAALVLVDPVYAERGNGVPLPSLLLAPLRVFFRAVARSFQRDGWLGRFIAWPFFKWAFLDARVRDATWPVQLTQKPIEYPRTVLEALDGVKGFPFRPFADELDVQTVLLEAVQRPRQKSRFSALVPRLQSRLGGRFTYDVVRSGHYLQLDRPDEVTRRLRALLDVSPTGLNADR
ncbi:MAG: alpha/beta hydrolase [Myxococcaceae bacterium]|nr:alpha/beta hydrolase [Myxococcaceae bacterium]